LGAPFLGKDISPSTSDGDYIQGKSAVRSVVNPMASDLTSRHRRGYLCGFAMVRPPFYLSAIVLCLLALSLFDPSSSSRLGRHSAESSSPIAQRLVSIIRGFSILVAHSGGPWTPWQAFP